VEIVVWDPEVHGPLAEKWIQARGLGEDAGDLSLLSPLGLVVDGIAMGFLYTTNSKLAFIDCFMTDPASDKAHRSRALDALIVHLMARAKELGYTAVVGTTSAQALAVRFAQHGFNVVAGSYVAKRV
jgi:hypothetical protein